MIPPSQGINSLPCEHCSTLHFLYRCPILSLWCSFWYMSSTLTGLRLSMAKTTSFSHQGYPHSFYLILWI
jgi:hypothetical protein